MDTSLGFKAHQATTCTKTEVDTALGLEAATVDVYISTQSPVDTALDYKL